MKKLLVSAMLLSLMFVVVGCGGSKTKSVSLEGQWKSVAAEDVGNGYFAARELKASKENWFVNYALFADKDMKKPLFAYTAQGTYKIEGASKVVVGASNAKFEIAKTTLKLLTTDAKAIKALGFDTCGLKNGVVKNISETGCGSMESVSKCAAEYDIVKVENGQLFLGARDPQKSLCAEENRPTTLNAALELVPAKN